MKYTLTILFVLILPAFAPAQHNTSKPTYEIYALSYGVIPDFSVANLLAGADQINVNPSNPRHPRSIVH